MRTAGRLRSRSHVGVHSVRANDRPGDPEPARASRLESDAPPLRREPEAWVASELRPVPPAVQGDLERRPSIVQVTLWNSPYLGNFMAGQLLLARAVAEELGFATHLVLAEGALDQPWRSELDRPYLSWSILPAGRSARIQHLERVARQARRGHRAQSFHAAPTSSRWSWRAAAARGACGRCTPVSRPTRCVSERRISAKVTLLGRYVDCVVAVSDWVATLARRRGFPAHRIALVPNGIVLDRFAALPDKVERASPPGPRRRSGYRLGVGVVAGGERSRRHTRGARAAGRARQAPDGFAGGRRAVGTLRPAGAPSWRTLAPPDEVRRGCGYHSTPLQTSL